MEAVGWQVFIGRNWRLSGLNSLRPIHDRGLCDLPMEVDVSSADMFHLYDTVFRSMLTPYSAVVVIWYRPTVRKSDEFVVRFTEYRVIHRTVRRAKRHYKGLDQTKIEANGFRCCERSTLSIKVKRVVRDSKRRTVSRMTFPICLVPQDCHVTWSTHNRRHLPTGIGTIVVKLWWVSWMKKFQWDRQIHDRTKRRTDMHSQADKETDRDNSIYIRFI